MQEKPEYLEYIKQSFELKNQKLYKEAIEVLYKVLCSDVDKSTLVEVISQIGDLHYLLKNYERAVEQYEKVLEIDSSHSHSKDKLYELYFELKEYQKALFVSEKVCADSKKPLDFVRYFTVLLKLGHADEIIEKYGALSEELKSDPNILYILSLLKEEGKREMLEKIVLNAPAFSEAKFDLALAYYNEGNFEQSEKLFDEILTTKKDALSYYYKALIQVHKKDYFHAIDNFHLAIKASKGNVQEFYFELAKAYIDINWFDEAIATIKSSISLSVEQNAEKSAIDKRYLLLAWIFEKQKDYDSALFNLTLIDENSPLKYQAGVLHAHIMYKKGEIIPAKIELEELYENVPQVRDDLTLLDTLGAIYKDLKLTKKALGFYKKHLESYPESLHTACEYIDLLIDLEEYGEAFSYIEKYSGFGTVPSLLNSKARIYYRKKEYDKALDELDKLILCDKNNAEAYYFKGLILNDKKNYNGALPFIQTALELNPVPAKYYAQCAKANFNLGFLNEAMLYIKEAIEIEPNNLNYKKLAADISKKSGKEHEAEFWNSVVSRTETIIKNNQRL